MYLNDLLYGDLIHQLAIDTLGLGYKIYSRDGYLVFEYSPLHGVGVDELGFFDENGEPTKYVENNDLTVAAFTLEYGYSGSFSSPGNLLTIHLE